MLIKNTAHIGQMSAITTIARIIDYQGVAGFDIAELGGFEIYVGIGFAIEHFI
jgi:hypothetical protein